MGKSRLEAFSDGVITIIITIMVLELKAPRGASLDALLPLWPVFVSYVLSFVYVGIYWNKLQFASYPSFRGRLSLLPALHHQRNRPIVRLLVSLWLICGIANAAPQMKTDNEGNPILTQYSEEGFVDCVFRITNLVETGTTYRFRMIASYEGEPVGMDVTVVKGIQAGMNAEMALIKDHVYRQGVTFSRTGPESDRLIRALSSMYGQKMSGVQMVQSESFTAIALHQGAIDMTKEPIKLKLFGRDGPTDHEDDYYESFFNLDLKNKLVFWNEKDQDYRIPLLRALSK